VFLRADTFTKLNDPPKLELLIASRQRLIVRELHSIDIEQAFLQPDKFLEGVNGQCCINPPPWSPDASNKGIVYGVLRPLYGNLSSPRALHKPWMPPLREKGLTPSDLRNPCEKGLPVENMLKISMC
jgi:hypothetical protein